MCTIVLFIVRNCLAPIHFRGLKPSHFRKWNDDFYNNVHYAHAKLSQSARGFGFCSVSHPLLPYYNKYIPPSPRFGWSRFLIFYRICTLTLTLQYNIYTLVVVPTVSFHPRPPAIDDRADDGDDDEIISGSPVVCKYFRWLALSTL